MTAAGEPSGARTSGGRKAVVIAGHRGDISTARVGLHAAEPDVRASALAALERAGSLTAVELAAGLADEAAIVRRRAAELAARHPDVSLLGVLRDADASVAEMAAWACGEHERADDEVLTELIALAGGHADPLVREAAVAALGAIGDDRGLPAILAATADKPAVRRRAVLALAPFDGDEVDAALRRSLEDRDWQVRQAAEELLRDD